MLARIHTRLTNRFDGEREGGFTLIELLVVIIIIGILAAIAIPVYLAQRNKAYDAQAKADLHNVATMEETYFTDNNAYTTSISAPTGTGAIKYTPSGATPVATAIFVNATGGTAGALPTTGYCLQVTATSGNIWSYNSALGGLQAMNKACP